MSISFNILPLKKLFNHALKSYVFVRKNIVFSCLMVFLLTILAAYYTFIGCFVFLILYMLEVDPLYAGIFGATASLALGVFFFSGLESLKIGSHHFIFKSSYYREPQEFPQVPKTNDLNPSEARVG